MADSSLLGLAAGAIPVVGGIISGVINNANTDSTNRANQAFQIAQQDKQNAYNTSQWNAQNAYNSPVEAMARFKAAGLNPNLIYGAGASSATFASAPPPSARTEYVARPHDPIDGAAIASQGIHAYNDTRIADANIDLTQKQALDTQKSIELKGFQEGLLAAEKSKTESEVPIAKSVIDLNEANSNRSTTLLPYDANAIAANTAKTKAETAGSIANMKMTLDENDRRAALNAMDIKSAAVKIMQMRADTAKSSAERSSILEMIPKIQQDTKAMSYDNALRSVGAQPHDAGWWRALSNYVDEWKIRTRRLFLQP